MATLVEATCSECFLPQVIELNPRRREIICGYCSHKVPMFEKRDMDGIRSALKQERSKTDIALLIFGAAVAFLAWHVWENTNPLVLQITASDGTVYTGYLVERKGTSVKIKDRETGEPIAIDFKEALGDKVAALREKYPLMPEDKAAAMVADESSKVLPQEKGHDFGLYLAALAALAALAFSAIATQDRLVCEF